MGALSIYLTSERGRGQLHALNHVHVELGNDIMPHCTHRAELIWAPPSPSEPDIFVLLFYSNLTGPGGI